MSNINTNNINSNNITSNNISTINLSVSYINGRPFNNTNYNNFIPCPSCDYTGPDVCDCGVPCDYVQDICDCLPTKHPKITSGNFSYYYDLQSGAQLVDPSDNGPGYCIDNVNINNNTTQVAFIYPSSAYFNEISGGTNPWSYVSPTIDTFNDSFNTTIFNMMPFKGVITAVSINVLTWFSTKDTSLNIVIADGNPVTYTGVNLGFPNFDSVTFPISGYTTNITNKSFSAGAGIACVIQNNGAPWSGFASTSGIISVNVFVNYII